MESHVAGEEGTITHPHLLTLTLRYWTTAALSVLSDWKGSDTIHYHPDTFDNPEVSVLLTALQCIDMFKVCFHMLNLTCYNM